MSSASGSVSPIAFFDGENFGAKYFFAVQEFLEKQVNGSVESRVYVRDSSSSQFKEWSDLKDRYPGAFQLRSTGHRPQSKVDPSLIEDCQKASQQNPKRPIALVAGDGDYAKLVGELRAAPGRVVWGISERERCSGKLLAAFGKKRFQYAEDLIHLYIPKVLIDKLREDLILPIAEKLSPDGSPTSACELGKRFRPAIREYGAKHPEFGIFIKKRLRILARLTNSEFVKLESGEPAYQWQQQ